jgi:hypothetical protein
MHLKLILYILTNAVHVSDRAALARARALVNSSSRARGDRSADAIGVDPSWLHQFRILDYTYNARVIARRHSNLVATALRNILFP